MASNGPRSKIELLLRLTGLDAFVPASRVFSAVELGRDKPDLALFLHAAAAMGGSTGRRTCPSCWISPGACRAEH